MTRTIKPSEIQPGMTVQWTYAGITRQCTPSYVETVSPRGGAYLRTFEGGSVQIPSGVEVTVLSDPQPEEPTAFGARVVAGECKALRGHGRAGGFLPWVVEFPSGNTASYNWKGVCELGPVTVIDADPHWTAPEDAPVVPDRIEEWDTWEDVPEGVVVTVPGLFCHYRKNQGVVEFSDPDDDPEWTEPGVRAMPRGYGPWTRATDA